MKSFSEKETQVELQEATRYSGNCPKCEVSPPSRRKSTKFVVFLEHSSNTGVGSRFKAKGWFGLVFGTAPSSHPEFLTADSCEGCT